MVAHEMWKLFNPNADTELDVSKLSDFVLSDQTGLENAGINMGYVSGENIWDTEGDDVFIFLISGHCINTSFPLSYSTWESINQQWEETSFLHGQYWKPCKIWRKWNFSGGWYSSNDSLKDGFSHSDPHQCNAGRLSSPRHISNSPL